MKLLGLLWSHSERWRRLSLAKIDINAPTEDHSEILSALRARNLRAAIRALEHHIQVSVKSLESTLPTSNEDGAAAKGVHAKPAVATRRRKK